MFTRRNIIIASAVLVVILGVILWPKQRSQEVAAKTTMIDKDAQKIFDEAKALEGTQSMLEAKTAYQRILTEYPDSENISQIQGSLEELNMKIIFSNTQTPKTVIHEVVSGDTLGGIAKKYNTTVSLVKTSNALQSDVIRLGQKLRIWTGTFNIYVDKSQNILILKDGDEVVKVYHVSTGKDNSTPVGTFKVTTKLIDPVWFNRGIVVPPESPENVLGTRWLGFDIPGYGIHGTIEPETIGQQVTAGCVRMRNNEVEELYSIIPMGTEVTIVD